VTLTTAESISVPARRRVRRYVAAGVLAALIVTGWFAWDWWTHPTQFGPAGNMFGAKQEADDLRPLHVGMTTPSLRADQDRLTLRHVEANVATDSAGTAITFTVCTRRPGQDPLGVDRGSLNRYCEEFREADGTEMVLGPHGRGDYLIMTLTPSRPGVVWVPSIDVTYGYGWSGLFRHGTETTGMSVRMKIG
jgi:hypothetical protein